MEKEMICIGCPMGCNLKVKCLENGEFVSVSGNTCKRGEEYAKTEIVNPQRTLTTTVRCTDGSIISVKTDKAIPKNKISEAMKIINKITVNPPIHIGDVIINDLFGSNVVATENHKNVIKLFLFDLDGTLYLGEKVFGFTKELLKKIRESGRDYLFVTNNSSKSVSEYVEKIRGLGIDADEADFITSSQATAYYLNMHHKEKIIYVAGTNGLKKELKNCGLKLTDNPDDAECVVVGFDTELTYDKLENVCRILTKRDVTYIATNPDLVCPTEYGYVPDCGSVCDMIYNATKKRPVVIGKPETLLPEMAARIKKCKKTEIAVVGDRIYTDIKCGINSGMKSILVMSGETTEEMLEQSPEKPDIVLKDAGCIMKML